MQHRPRADSNRGRQGAGNLYYLKSEYEVKVGLEAKVAGNSAAWKLYLPSPVVPGNQLPDERLGWG